MASAPFVAVRVKVIFKNNRLICPAQEKILLFQKPVEISQAHFIFTASGKTKQLPGKFHPILNVLLKFF